jgi:hypothetical protein
VLLAAALNLAICDKRVFVRKANIWITLSSQKHLQTPAFMDEGTIVVIRAYATNEAKADELWNLCEKLIGKVFKY